MSETIRIVIPQYIRRVKMSEKQIPMYWEYKDGVIKSGNKKLPDSFYSKEGLENIILDNGKVRPGYLKPIYSIYYFKNGKPSKPIEGARRFLCGTVNHERILANPKKVGTPRIKMINAQDIFSGKIQSFEKEAIMYKIKQHFAPFIQNMSALDVSMYPVRIRLYLYDTVKNYHDRSLQDDSGTRWDIINRSYMYMKAFGDLLVEGLKDKSINVPKILIDDERLFLTEDGGCVFMPIDKHENRKLVFVIGKDDEKFNESIKDLENEHVWLIKNNRFYKELKQKYEKNI